MKRLSILVLAIVMLLGVPAIVGAWGQKEMGNPSESGVEGNVSVEVKMLPYAELGLFTNVWVDEFTEPGVKSNQHWFHVWTNVPVSVTVSRSRVLLRTWELEPKRGDGGFARRNKTGRAE